MVLTTPPHSWFPDEKEAWTQNRSDGEENVIQFLFKPLFKVTFKIIEQNLTGGGGGGRQNKNHRTKIGFTHNVIPMFYHDETESSSKRLPGNR